MEDIKDILQRRSNSIGTNQLTIVEAVKKAALDITGVSVRVIRLQYQTATVAVESSVAGSEVRFHASEIIDRANQSLSSDQRVKQLRVTVR